MSDQTIIDEAAERFLMGEQIDSLQARVIANAWHGGQWSALYSFTSTGHIDVEDLSGEIEGCLIKAPEESREELRALLAYVHAHGPREPQAGWSNLHW